MYGSSKNHLSEFKCPHLYPSQLLQKINCLIPTNNLGFYREASEHNPFLKLSELGYLEWLSEGAHLSWHRSLENSFSLDMLPQERNPPVN